MNESRLDELIALSANLTSIIDHSCSSYVFDNTSKVAESYLPNLPELTLNEKVHKFLQSKSMEKTKKRSLQNLNNKKFKILVEKSNPEMNQNPPYFRSHSTLESIIFLFCFLHTLFIS